MEQKDFTPGFFQEEVTIRALLEVLGQAVVTIDHLKNIILVNKRAEEMFGYQAVEVIGKSHDILLPTRFLEIHLDHMHSYFKEPRIRPMGIGLDLFGMRKDGSEFPVEISLSYVNTSSGILIFSLITDISVRKNAEAQIHQKAELLADANRELERFNRIAVGRELRMIEMKKEINALCERLGEPPRYSLEFTDEQKE